MISFLTAFCITALVFGTAALIVVPKMQSTLYTYTGTTQKDPSELVVGFEPVTDTEVTSTEAGFSVLLVGTDKRPGVEVSSVDSLILMKICPSKKAVVFMPIPTDIKVSASDGEQFLSELRNTEGMDYLCEKIKGLTGTSINYYAIASLKSFKNIVNDLGGIEYNVPETIHCEKPDEDYEINIAKGYQVLDGDDAAKLMRYSEGGIGARMELNTTLLKNLIRKHTAEQYKSNALDLYNTIIENTTTNFTETDLAENIEAIFSYHNCDEIDLVYPGEYEKNNKGEYVFVPNTSLAYEMMDNYK